MRPIKFLTILIIFSSKLLAQNAEQDSATAYSNRAFQSFDKKDYAQSLFWYEKLFNTSFKDYRSNYNLYRASVSACQINEPSKALHYFEEMASTYLDFNNYTYFANDTLANCLKETAIWKNAMAYMKPKYDSVQEVYRLYYVGITDASKRLTKSDLNDTSYLKKLFAHNNFKNIFDFLKNYNRYNQPPLTNHWTLYEIKINDTLTVPFLIFVPKNYVSSKKTSLYVFLQGAVSNRSRFSTKANVPESEIPFIQNPIKQGAFIIYPFARKDINWLQHPLAFETIINEIAYVKSLYNIDDNKVYITGHSDGGRGVFYFAINKPSTFASFLAFNYYPQSFITNTSLRNFRNQETFYGISGKKDNIFNFSKVDSIYRYANSVGCNWRNFAFDEGHGLPYDIPDSLNFIYDTLINKKRKPFPKFIEWETDNVDNGRYKWIEILKIDTLLSKASWVDTYNPPIKSRDNITPVNFNKNKSAVIVASVKGNTVTIKTSRVTQFCFYVYPEVVNIKKPIKFIINNTVQTIIPKPSKEDLAKEILKTKDRTMLPIQKITLASSN
ncbi:MAG: hypothetical protein ACR2KX_03345 [Chitinophagaceae bacterium]